MMNERSFIKMNKNSPKDRDPIQAQLVDARRNQILDAATQVFAKKGFHGATIRQIAQQAGIADGTIYIYFQNKPDLLLGILNRLNETERRATDLRQGLTGDFRGFFVRYVRHRLTVMEENLRAFQAVLPDILANAELRERYLREVIEPSFKLAEPVMQAWIATAVIRPGNVALMLRAVSGMFLGMLVLRMMGDTTVEKMWSELPEFLTGIFFDGLLQEQKSERSLCRSEATGESPGGHYPR